MKSWEELWECIERLDDLDAAVDACAAVDVRADASRVADLYDRVLTGKDFFVREAAAVPLARLEGGRAFPALFAAILLGEAENHDNDGLTAVVWEVIDESPQECAVELRKELAAAEATHRRNAAWLFGHLPPKGISPEPLLNALADEDRETRLTAIRSLSVWLPDERVHTALGACARSEDATERELAAEAFASATERLAESN